MTSKGRISRAEAERVLSGAYVAPGEPGASRDLAAFAAALRSAVPELPDPGLETSLVPALAEAAASATHGGSLDATVPMSRVGSADRPPAWRRRLVVIAAAVASLPVLMAGLAYAGVSLPDAVDRAFDAVGVGLPNQSDADDTDSDGHANANGDGNGASQQGRDARAASEASAADAHGPSGHANVHSDTNGKAKGHSHGHGPSGAAPPGHGGVAPGQGGVPPGNGGVPPGGGSDGSTGPPPSAGSPPSAGAPATAPGGGGTPPGQAD